jgi:uncharacterized protein (DUF58 family)
VQRRASGAKVRMQAERIGARALAQRYRLALMDVPRRGHAGEVVGRGTGSSLEFQDRRNYFAGDDVRHIDWRAMARTDQLMVRVYREELRPRLELLIDTSRSMNTSPEKAEAALELLRFFAQLGTAGGIEVRCIAIGERPQLVDLDRLAGNSLEFEARSPLALSLAATAPLFGAGCLRLLVSDFLSPYDAREIIQPLSTHAGAIVLVQVLSQFDANPQAGEALRLTDAETELSLDAWIDAGTLERYRARLAALVSNLEVETRRVGGRFFSIVADEPLELSCSSRFVPAGLIEPA